jgi:hypothetical protein
MKIRSLLLMVVAASAIPLTHTSSYEFAQTFASNSPLLSLITGRSAVGIMMPAPEAIPSHIETVARDWSRTNANNAIALQYGLVTGTIAI